jgi:hypothetical protein
MYFEWTHNSNRQKGWPWCAGTRVSLDAERMPTCKACGKKVYAFDAWRGSFACDLEGGTRWSDIIGSGSTGPSVLVSERVRTALSRLSAGLDFHPMSISSIASKKLSASDAPPYYVIAFKRRHRLQRAASGLPPAGCEICQRASGTDMNARPSRLVAEPPLVDAVFAFANYRPGIGFCDESLVQAAHDEQWTNFRFEAFDVDRQDALDWAGLDYRADDWRSHLYPPHGQRQS